MPCPAIDADHDRSRLDDGWAETLERLRAFVAPGSSTTTLAADITQDVLVRSIASGALDTSRQPAGVAVPVGPQRRHRPLPHPRRHDRPSTPSATAGRPEPDDQRPNDATRELARCLQPLVDSSPPSTATPSTRVDLDRTTHPGRRRPPASRLRHEVPGPSEAAANFDSLQPAAPCKPTATERSTPIDPTSVAATATAVDVDHAGSPTKSRTGTCVRATAESTPPPAARRRAWVGRPASAAVARRWAESSASVSIGASGAAAPFAHVMQDRAFRTRDDDRVREALDPYASPLRVPPFTGKTLRPIGTGVHRGAPSCRRASPDSVMERREQARSCVTPITRMAQGVVARR